MGDLLGQGVGFGVDRDVMANGEPPLGSVRAFGIAFVSLPSEGRTTPPCMNIRPNIRVQSTRAR